MLKRLGGFALLEPLAVFAFRRLWAGAGLSMLADQAFLVSLTWLVLEMTGSGSTLGVVLAVASVPGLLLMPLGGVLSDRFSPAPVMVWASAGRALLLGTLAGLVLADAAQVWHIYLLAGGLSALDALYYPASMSMVPRLVSGDRLEAANGLTQGAEQISGVLGPALAALLLALAGLGAGLGINAALFLASAALFMTVVRSVPRGSAAVGSAGEDDDEDTAGTLQALVGGARYVLSDPIIRTIMLVLVGINLAMAGPLYVGGAVLAEVRLGGAGAFGTLVAAGGAGSLLGAVCAGSLGRIRRRGVVELGLTAALGLEVAAFSVIPNILLAGALAVAVGATASFLAVVNISWLQQRSEAGLTGRVMSMAMFAAVALDPVSYLLAGAFVEINLEAVFVSAGLLLVLTALLGATSRTMRTAD